MISSRLGPDNLQSLGFDVWWRYEVGLSLNQWSGFAEFQLDDGIPMPGRQGSYLAPPPPAPSS